MRTTFKLDGGAEQVATVLNDHLRQDWRQRAACRRLDTALFFPMADGDPVPSQVEDAKAVCRACAVQTMCLEFSLATNQKQGIWGGLTEDERRSLRRRRARRRRAS